MLSQFVVKVMVEVVFTPLTYKRGANAEAGGERGLLRPADQLHALQPEDLRR
jgi:hypothetical protein